MQKLERFVVATLGKIQSIATRLLRINTGIQDYLVKEQLTSQKLHYAVSTVWYRAALHSQLCDSRERERLFGTIALRIRQSSKRQTILNTTVEEVRQFLRCDRVVVFQLSPDLSGEVVAASVTQDWPSILGWKMEKPCFYDSSKDHFLQGQARAIDDIYQANLSDCNLQFHEELQIRASLIVPILLTPDRERDQEDEGDKEEFMLSEYYKTSPSSPRYPITPSPKLWGLLIAHQCATPRNWHNQEVELIGDLAIQIAIGIQQALLLEQVQQENRERRKTEATLAVYKKIVSSSQEAISFVDHHYIYRAVNPICEQRFGLPSTKIVGCSLAEILGENIFTTTVKPYLDRALLGEKVHYEHWFNFEQAGQKFIQVSYYPYYESSGIISGVVVSTSDITQRKLVEEALEHQLLHTRLLQQITEQIRKTLDTQEIFETAALKIGRAFGVNRCIIHNYTAAPVPRMPVVAEYLAGDLVSFLGEEIPVEGNFHAQQVLSQEEAVVSNNVKEDPLLQPFDHLCQRFQIKSMLAVRTSYQEQINGVIGLHQCDHYRQWTPEEIVLFEAVAAQLGIALVQAQLLEREKQQRYQLQHQNQALEQATQVAQAANRAKSEFLANMSHEIRTPMNAILGFCELLQKCVTEPRQKSYVQSISSSGNTLLALINDILDLSKIEAGKLEVDYASLNLRLLIKEIQQIFSQQVSSKNLTLLTDIQETVPTGILFDGVRLRQILFNLVGNALKFTENGHIKISVSWQERLADKKNKEDSEKSSLAPQTLLTIAIEDTGIGINVEQQQQIFKAFVQNEGSINRKYGGTGLGLTITQRLTRLLGGTIEVKSQFGKGSTFTLNFPQVSLAKVETLEVELVEIKQIEPAEEFEGERLLELLEKLRIEEETFWSQLQITMKRREIRAFAQRLNQWAYEHQCQILLEYVTRLDNQLKVFDWEHLPETLQHFPQVRKALERNRLNY
ncbi:GAF domain-containing protein [Lyngbya aestuarii]|uniref:GAF domain-containing protein n=1 Tax=Lyngbya aestuarii TaxID=118322 RepID=UPI00403E0734